MNTFVVIFYFFSFLFCIQGAWEQKIVKTLHKNKYTLWTAKYEFSKFLADAKPLDNFQKHTNISKSEGQVFENHNIYHQLK